MSYFQNFKSDITIFITLVIVFAISIGYLVGKFLF